MPSEHFVKLTTISNIKSHPNADTLEIAEIEGWQVVHKKGTFTIGDRVIFVPVDSIVPEKWAKEWEVYDYLGGKLHDRVRCVKLRGEPSYGFTVPIPTDLENKKTGTDVKDYFCITKYEPPVRNSGNTAPQGSPTKCHPLLHKYTDIDNLRNYTEMFQEGEEVIITEKIHGANFRVGLVDSKIQRKDTISKLLRFFRIKNRTELAEEWIAG
jgi:RNA ligase (TIGR02306 family)